MIERALRDAVVVGLDAAGERCLKLGSGVEPRLPDEFRDAPVESLDHPLGLRVTGRRESVRNAQARTALVERVFARRLPGFSCEPVRELAAVVSEDLADLHGCSRVQAPPEIAAAGFALIGIM